MFVHETCADVESHVDRKYFPRAFTVSRAAFRCTENTTCTSGITAWLRLLLTGVSYLAVQFCLYIWNVVVIDQTTTERLDIIVEEKD